MYVRRLWDGAYGLLPLSEKTKKFNRLQMSFQGKQFLLSNLKTPELVASRLADRRLSNWANRAAVNSESEGTDPGI